MDSLKDILKTKLIEITPSKEEFIQINSKLKEIMGLLKKNISKSKIKASVFIGGSYAKNTIIKKNKYDIDIFIRFDKSYSEEQMAKLIARIVPKTANKLHGSRDYYIIKDNSTEFEIIPCLAVKLPQNARNVTDLSYFHVKYVLDAIKKKKSIADEIKLAKSFVHAAGCYGAESYIQGFSGYALELLVIHYKSFFGFVKAVASFKDRIIIDDFKAYKKILEEMNESKLQSPIILVDPTFKQRNALAALNPTTFDKFKKYCTNFLNKPAASFFEVKDISPLLEKKYGSKLTKIEVQSDRQAGDIAGTKLRKFYSYFIFELEKCFSVIKSDFEYLDQENKGIIYVVAEPKKLIEFKGPPLVMKEALVKFKKEHKKIIIKNGKAFAFEKNKFNLQSFIKWLKNKNSKVISEMSVSFVE